MKRNMPADACRSVKHRKLGEHDCQGKSGNFVSDTDADKTLPDHDNPYRALIANIFLTEFAVFCTETLKDYGEIEGFKDFSIKHNQVMDAHDENYQIDALAEFPALGTTINVIVECKKYLRPIESSGSQSTTPVE